MEERKIRFTDSFFEFPIKVYEGRKKEDLDEEEEEIEGSNEFRPWIQGRVKINIEDIESGMYYQEWIGNKSIEEIRDEGYTETAVWIERYGEFICLWPYRKFEAKLNEFIARQPQEEKEEDLNL